MYIWRNNKAIYALSWLRVNLVNIKRFKICFNNFLTGFRNFVNCCKPSFFISLSSDSTEPLVKVITSSWSPIHVAILVQVVAEGRHNYHCWPANLESTMPQCQSTVAGLITAFICLMGPVMFSVFNLQKVIYCLSRPIYKRNAIKIVYKNNNCKLLPDASTI